MLWVRMTFINVLASSHLILHTSWYIITMSEYVIDVKYNRCILHKVQDTMQLWESRTNGCKLDLAGSLIIIFVFEKGFQNRMFSHCNKGLRSLLYLSNNMEKDDVVVSPSGSTSHDQAWYHKFDSKTGYVHNGYLSEQETAR